MSVWPSAALYREHLDAFAAEAEEATQAAMAALAAVAEPLAEAHQAWNHATAAWSPLLEALKERVARDEDERGIWRDRSTVTRLAQVPRLTLPLLDDVQPGARHRQAEACAGVPQVMPAQAAPVRVVGVVWQRRTYGRLKDALIELPVPDEVPAGGGEEQAARIARVLGEGRAVRRGVGVDVARGGARVPRRAGQVLRQQSRIGPGNATVRRLAELLGAPNTMPLMSSASWPLISFSACRTWMTPVSRSTSLRRSAHNSPARSPQYAATHVAVR